MAENSGISWTHNTFNPWRGCTKVSEGCRNCYAETMSGRNPGVLGIWGPNGNRVVAAESYWREPIKWNKQAAEAGERRRVFCASLADVFEDWDGPMMAAGKEDIILGEDYRASNGKNRLTMDMVRRRLFELIRVTPWLDWLILTKRPERMAEYVRTSTDSIDGVIAGGHWPSDFPNVWLGTSAENQKAADERIPHLLQTPAAVRFLSCEPLLGPVNLSAYFGGEYATVDGSEDNYNFGVDWVIVGGESGHDARPMHWRWAWSLRDQCQAAGVPFFFKQWGEWTSGIKSPMDREQGAASYMPGKYHDFGDDTLALKVGKKNAGEMLDGRLWQEFPTAAEVR
jgi:protein gp37